MMDDPNLQIAMILLAGAVGGIVVGWLMRGPHSKRRLNELEDEWQIKLDNVVRQRDRFIVEIDGLRSTIETQQANVRKLENATHKKDIELQSAHEKSKSLQKDVFTLRAEREDFKGKVSSIQNALTSVRQQTAELQAEFIKSGDFYKSELAKSFEKRKLLEAKVSNAMLEHESFSNLLQASRSEHASVNKMLTSAQTRLNGLDSMEQSVIELEAENAQLKHDSAKIQQENEVLQRDIAEQDELKVQNKELAHCLKSMENSRKQYESDAQRYRNHAGQSEQQSETLRIRLDEVEKNFAEIEKQQRNALTEVRKEALAQKSNGQKQARQEADDLQEIVGIGRVFESALHKLGIHSFQQIAAFDVADIARVNAELKECRGRLEQDDWIGQAKDLHFRKYGGAG
jgi:predicted flap endonuclease-1-like 5' DNA nuclease